MPIKASQKIIDRIKEFEGFEPIAYKDAKTGKTAIGYGDTEGDTSRAITEAEASMRLAKRIAKAEEELSGVISASLSQNKMDALIDMHYNAGLGGMGKIIERVNGGLDDQTISNALALYNKSTDAKTGEKYIVPALQDRANFRSALWLEKDEEGGVNRSPNGQFDMPDNVNANDLLDGVEEAEKIVSSSVAPEVNAQAGFDILEGLPTPEPRLIPQDKKTGLDITAESMGEYATAEVLRGKEAKRISKLTGKSEEEVYSELYTYTDKEILARNAHAITAKYFPAVANWGQKEDNYVLMRENPEYPQRIEARTRALSPNNDSDFIKALKMNEKQLQAAGVWTAFALGKSNLEDLKAAALSLDEDQRELALSPEIQKVQEEAGKFDVSAGLKKAIDAIFPDSGGMQLNWDAVVKAYDGSEEAFDAFIDKAKVYFSNPEATAIMAAQSAVGTVLPMGMALSGNPAGIAGAMAIAAGMAMGERMQENLEAFRNPETGLIDVDKAFSDPKRLDEWRTGLKTYATVMGTAEAALGLKWGKYFAKAVPKKLATSAVGQGVKKVAQTASKIPGAEAIEGVAGNTVKGAVEEGLGQLAASTSADVVEGKPLKQSLIKNIDSATEEAIFGAFIGGGLTVGGMSVGKATQVRAKYKLNKATKANVDAVNTSQLRATISSDEKLKDNKEEVKALVEEAVNPSSVGELVSSMVSDPFENIDSVSDVDVRYSSINKKDTVEISPSEWDEHHQALGIDPAEAISKLGPETQAAYMANKMTDSSFAIPISEWVTYTPEELDPSVDEIIRVKGNELNAKEANAAIEQMQADPFTEFNIRPSDEDTPPPAPGEQVEGESQIKIAPPDEIAPWSFVEYEKDGEVKALPITLVTQGNTETEQKMLSDIMSAMKFSTEQAANIEPETLEFIAQFQLNHNKARARLTDRSLEDIMKGLKFGKMKRSEEVSKGGITLGYYQAKRFFDDVAKIAFGTRADPFTIIHELGHSWLQEMAEDYQYIFNKQETDLRADQLEYKRAMETMAKLLNLDNVGQVASEFEELLTAKGDRYNYLRAKRTRYHETFAQTAERYFIDGKFKNSKIRALLEQFKKWLKPFMAFAGEEYAKYKMSWKENGETKSFKGIPYLKITPEVERLFEVILGATEAAENTVVPMFQPPMFDPKMLGAEGPEYLEAHTAALGEAIGETYYAIVDKFHRAREKEINKFRNELYAEAEANVDKLPAMNVLKFFEENPNMKLSLESVAETLFKGNIDAAVEFRKTIPKSIVAARKKGGYDVKQFMLQNELTDTDAVIQLFENAGKRDEFVEAEYNRLAKLKVPALKSDEEIHEIAVKKMNSDGKAKLLDKEMKILATKKLAKLKGMAEKAINPASYVGRDSILTIKLKAAKDLYSSSISSFSPAGYLSDSERHGRRAAEAFSDNDIMKSYDMKYAQSVDFYKYKEAEKISKDMVKTEKLIDKIERYETIPAEVAKKYDVGLLSYANSVVKAIKAGQKIPMLTREDFYKTSAISDASIDDINKSMEAMSDRINGATYANISVQDFLTIGDLLSLMVKTSKKLREVQIGNEKKQAEAFAREAVGGMSGDNVVSYEKSGPDAKLGGKIRVEKVNVPTLFKTLYKTDEEYLASPVGRVLTAIKNAEALRNNHFTKTEKKINELLQKCVNARKGDLNFKVITDPLLKRVNVVTGKEWDAPIFAPELGINFKNRQQLFMACLHMLGSESGLLKFLKGNTAVNDPRLVDVFIKRMIDEGELIKEDFEFFQAVWDANEEVYDGVNEAMITVDNREVGYIKPKPFKNKFGEFRGGYMRSSPSEKGQRKLKGTLPDKEDKPFGIDIYGMFPSRQIGLTKERTEAVYELDLDLRNVTRYLSVAYNIAYLRAPMHNFSKLMKTKTMEDVLEARRPGALTNVVAPWVARVNDQIYTEYSTKAKDSIARFFRNNMNTAIYFGNLKSALNQYYGLSQLAAKVGAKDFTKSMWAATSSPKATISMIKEKSPRMADRFERSIRDTARSIQELNANFDWIDWTSDKIKDYSFIMSQMTQNHVDMISWRAGYAKALNKGMTEADAIAFADDLVETTQTSPTVSFMANIQAGTDTHKLFTQILSVPTGIANMASVEAQRDQTFGAKASAIAKLFLWTTSLPVLISMLIGGDADDEEEEDMESFLWEMAQKNAAGAVDMVFPLMSRPVTFGGSLGPVLGALKDTGKTLKAAKQKTEGVDMTDYQFNLMMNHLTMYTGNALPILFKTINMMDAAMESKEDLEQEQYNRRYQLEELRYNKAYSKFD